MFWSIVNASAITYKYDNYNKKSKTCTLVGWGGNSPSSGKISIKSTCTKDGVTYTVTEIAPHALDGLPDVHQITIPATIVKIGDIDSENPSIGAQKGSLRNFNRCYSLTKFIVEDGNTVFAANADGWLMSKGGRNIYRITLANEQKGELKISNYVYYIYADAFPSNSTITKVTLSSGLKQFYPSCGLHKLTGVKEYYVAPRDGAKIISVDGVLFSSGTRLYAYPPCKSGETYEVPSHITIIGQYAFANNEVLRTVVIPDKVRIREYAFENAASIYTIKGGVPLSIGRRAFYKAMNLSVFPFSASTELDGDSIFFNSGFTNIKYDDGAYVPVSTPNRFTFGDDRLSLLRMDQIQVTSTDPKDAFPFYSDFASGCTGLRIITLPNRTIFKKDLGTPAFCGPYNLTYLQTGSFRVEGGNTPFVFNVINSDNTLNVVTATDSSTEDIDKYAEWGFLFKGLGHTGVNPNIYTDMRAPYAPDAQSHYVFNTVWCKATYYVPGLCARNYSEATQNYCTVKELYDISLSSRNGKAIVSVAPLNDRIRFTGLSVNGGSPMSVGTGGDFDTGVNVSGITSVKLQYIISLPNAVYPGPSMSTTYTLEDFGMSGVEDVESGTSESPVEYYNVHGVRVENPSHGVYIRKAASEVTKVMIP